MERGYIYTPAQAGQCAADQSAQLCLKRRSRSLKLARDHGHPLRRAVEHLAPAECF
jgi:hypothetical protein